MPGKAVFWVFNQSYEVAVPEKSSAEQHRQVAEVISEQTDQANSAVKQTAITDFFSPRPDVPTQQQFAVSPFITPCPSVSLAEVPTVFSVQSGCVVDDYVDPTRSLFASVVHRPSSGASSVKTDSSPAEKDLDTASPKQNAATKKGMCLKRYSEVETMLILNSDRLPEALSSI